MGWSRPHLSMENPEAEIVFPFAGTPVGARQFSNVMIDSGKLAPTKIARRELRKNASDARLLLCMGLFFSFLFAAKSYSGQLKHNG
jgi:hypothetical protein